MLKVTHVVRQPVDVNLSLNLRKHLTAIISHDCRIFVIFKISPRQYDILFQAKRHEGHFAGFLAYEVRIQLMPPNGGENRFLYTAHATILTVFAC